MVIFSMVDVLEPSKVRKAVVEASAIDCLCEPSMTQQQFAEDCDLNRIMAVYAKTGVLPVGQFDKQVHFGDATSFDFQAAMDLIASGQTAFELLDANVRIEFNNDPVQLLQALEDPDQRAKLERVGLVVPRAPEPVPAGPAAPVNPVS